MQGLVSDFPIGKLPLLHVKNRSGVRYRALHPMFSCDLFFLGLVQSHLLIAYIRYFQGTASSHPILSTSSGCRKVVLVISDKLVIIAIVYYMLHVGTIWNHI